MRIIHVLLRLFIGLLSVCFRRHTIPLIGRSEEIDQYTFTGQFAWAWGFTQLRQKRISRAHYKENVSWVYFNWRGNHVATYCFETKAKKYWSRYNKPIAVGEEIHIKGNMFFNDFFKDIAIWYWWYNWIMCNQ
jgi:hypothetical protein